MSRAQAKRLSKTAQNFSPRQIVLAHLEEAHRHPSLLDYAASLPAHIPRDETISGRIEASVMARMKGQDRQAVNQEVRRQCREGLFLARLARDCELRALGDLRESDLWWVLLFYLGRSLHLARPHGQDGDGWKQEHRRGCTAAVVQLARLRATVQGIELIERTYFAGRPVLFATTRARLEESISRMQELTAAIVGLGASEGGDADNGRRRPARRDLDDGQPAPETRDAPEAVAAALVAGAKAETLSAMGDDHGAAALMRPYLATE